METPLRNCAQSSIDQSNIQKLPPRPDRLSVYSRSLEKLGSHLSQICHYFILLISRQYHCFFYFVVVMPDIACLLNLLDLLIHSMPCYAIQPLENGMFYSVNYYKLP